jgi:hypothetical protein
MRVVANPDVELRSLNHKVMNHMCSCAVETEYKSQCRLLLNSHSCFIISIHVSLVDNRTTHIESCS